jgi:molybdenum cofactor cytidylyltransferase
MNLARALRVFDDRSETSSSSGIGSESPTNAIAFIGSGGKTTAIFQLARELSGGNESKFPRGAEVRGESVIVSATTHMGDWQVSLADQHIIVNSEADLAGIEFQGVTLVTGPGQKDGRLQGVTNQVISWLYERAEKRQIPLLIEADGSRQRPLKAPGENEPAVPDFVDTVIVMAGLMGLGKPLLEEFIHRPEIYSALSGLAIGEPVLSEAILRVLTHPLGGLKNLPVEARKVMILNQADTPELQSAAQAMLESLLGSVDAVVIASLTQHKIFAAYERVAGIILAAGEARRFGQSKQLLDWRGEPFVRAVAKTALDAGLSPVAVVVGANGDNVEAAVRDLPVKIVRNANWPRGQSSSIRAGLASLPEHTGSSIFLLADQPQVTTAVLRALVAQHASELFSVVAPLVMMEQRANPVLFDRTTFPDLLALEGDVGGRALFSKYEIEYLPWHDDSLLLDVDKPEDYPRMKELE